MDRLACVDVPSLALQILVGDHRDWSGCPTAVVSQDTPQGEILQINRIARRSGILPGQRYASALSLCPDLCAGTISIRAIDDVTGLIKTRLGQFTPDVEADLDEPGVFWLNATGMGRIHSSPKRWAKAINDSLRESGFESTVAVGFTRFGTYALARGGRGEIVSKNPEQEIASTRMTPLSMLGLPPTVHGDLGKLGVTTVEQLLALPASGLMERFGAQAHRLHEMASGNLWAPIQPDAVTEPIVQHTQLDLPDTNSTRLSFLIKQMLNPMIRAVAARGEAITELEMGLALDHAGDVVERIRLAAPTLDELQIANLVRLRLESITLRAGVVEVALAARTVEATPEQLRLFSDHGKRDSSAADKAFERIRARYGHDSVVRAVLTEGHLPEAQFRWEQLDSSPKNWGNKEARARKGAITLVRRIYTRPIPMNVRPVAGPNGVHLRGMEHEPVSNIVGPYVVSGGWWHKEIQREYHFAQTGDGKVLWVYYDKKRHRWFLQGEVD